MKVLKRLLICCLGVILLFGVFALAGCDQSGIGALFHTEHTWEEVVHAPTCVSEGYTEYVCSVCGAVREGEKLNILPATGVHTWEGESCSVCGKSYAEWLQGGYYEFTLLKNGTYCISGCTADIPEEITLPSSYEGKAVMSIGDKAFYGCSGLTSIVIPDSVTSIGDKAFYGCSGLTSIVIPDSVTSIGSWAFGGCSSLTSIVIPDSVTSIGDYAFYCSSLTSVVIPDSVTSIGKDAFAYCNGLTSVVIPDGVTSIGKQAFYECRSLVKINYGGSLADWCAMSHSNNHLYLHGSGTLTIGGKKLEGDLTIPSGVTSIGNYAFYYCTGLTSVTIGNGVTSIGDRAFYNCTGLTSVTIGNGVTSIGDYAFEDCSRLTSIVIPDSVTSIGASAFSGCTGLAVTMGESVTCNVVYGGVIGTNAFYGCNGLTVTIENGVTSIWKLAFYGCSGLTSIVIPDSVTSIGDWAFYNCTGLKDVYYRGTEAQWRAISIGSNNSSLTNATIHYNYAG